MEKYKGCQRQTSNPSAIASVASQTLETKQHASPCESYHLNDQKFRNITNIVWVCPKKKQSKNRMYNDVYTMFYNIHTVTLKKNCCLLLWPQWKPQIWAIPQSWRNPRANLAPQGQGHWWVRFCDPRRSLPESFGRLRSLQKQGRPVFFLIFMGHGKQPRR